MPLLGILAGLWGNPLSRLIMVGVLAFGFGWVQGFRAVPRIDPAAIERNAIAGRDAYWQAQLSEANKLHEAALVAALEAAKDVTATPGDLAERLRVCRAPGSHCRDKDRR